MYRGPEVPRLRRSQQRLRRPTRRSAPPPLGRGSNRLRSRQVSTIHGLGFSLTSSGSRTVSGSFRLCVSWQVRRLVLHKSLILLDPGALGPVELERRYVAVILRVPIARAVTRKQRTKNVLRGQAVHVQSYSLDRVRFSLVEHRPSWNATRGPNSGNKTPAVGRGHCFNREAA